MYVPLIDPSEFDDTTNMAYHDALEEFGRHVTAHLVKQLETALHGQLSWSHEAYEVVASEVAELATLRAHGESFPSHFPVTFVDSYSTKIHFHAENSYPEYDAVDEAEAPVEEEDVEE